MRRAFALTVLLACILWAAWLYAASDLYFAQTSTGSGNGSSCANALAISTINSGGNWVAGNTLHLCGTITGAANSTAVIAQASGTSGSRITIKGEPGNLLTAPYWSLTGAINLNGKSFLTVDSVNIQNTANGTGLANAAGSYGIFSSGGHDITIQNSTISNICLKTTGASSGCSTSNVQADGMFIGGGNNIVVTGNTLHDAHWLIFMAFPSGSTTTGWSVTNNVLYNADHMIAVGDANPGATLSGMVITGNTMHDMVNWDGSAGFHHDYIHVFTGTNGGASTVTGLQVCNNVMYGDPGSSLTAFIFLENNTGNTYTGTLLCNNFLTNSSTTHIPGQGYIDASNIANSQFYGNNIYGSTTSQAFANECFRLVGSNFTMMNNTCYNVGWFVIVNNASGIPISSGNSDYNNWFQSGDAFFYNSAGHSFTQWKIDCPSCDTHSIQVLPNTQTTSPFRPLSGSGLINKGLNLTSLAIPLVNTDINGVLRPASGAWDIGPAQSTSVIPPNPPTGLSASVAGSTVTLSATPSSGTPVPTGYSLYRGTVHGGPYTLIKTALSSPSTTDTPANGTYFYTMTAFVGGLVSTISGNGTTATVTCMTACPSFPAGTTFTIFGDSVSPFNGTFTSTGQPTSSTFTFASSTNSVGSGGAAWPTTQESTKSNEAQATVPATLTVTLLPASRTFASQTVGTPSSTQSVTLTNTSGPGQSVTISSKSITGANSGDFSQTNNCPASLSSGASCIFNVTFTPTAAGARTATLAVVDNATGSPHTVTLNGTGVAATPAVTLTPAAIVFGDQLTGTTSVAVPVTLQNTGTGTLSISSISATGDFGQSNGCGATLGAGLSCTINVTFSPTLTGTRTGSIQVTDNASGSPHQVSLTGTGITTKCALTGAVTLDGAAGVCQ